MANSDHIDFSKYTLGRMHEVLEVDSSVNVSAACLAMFVQATRDIVIVSRDLDPMLFDNSQTSIALRDFLLRSRRVRLRILVSQADALARRGHRLVELVQRLTSFAEIRVPAAEHSTQNSAYVIADSMGLVHRTFADRFEATVSFGDRKLAADSLHRFEEMWQVSLPAASLRRMSL